MTRATVLAVASFFSLSLLSAVARAEPMAQDLVHLRLVADTRTIQPGKAFMIGLVVEITPGWHIYWTNPGDSGQATTATFNLPTGFKVSDLQYPTPTRFVQPGDIVGYGYHSKVMLMAKVTPPDDLRKGSEVPLAGTVNYLVCQRVCIPGKQSDAKLYKVADSATPDNMELFKYWERALPVPAEQSSAVASVESDATSVTVHWKTPPKSDVEFFPGASDAVAIGNITVLNEGDRTQVLFTPKVYDKAKLGPITSLIAFTGADDVRRAIVIPMSMKDPAGKK